jgi:hypothetical protein
VSTHQSPQRARQGRARVVRGHWRRTHYLDLVTGRPFVGRIWVRAYLRAAPRERPS